MSAFNPIQYQCRSNDSLYMFQLSSNELSLKILSLSKEVLFNEKFSSGALPFSEFHNLLSKGEATAVLSQLVARQSLPQRHLPSTEPKEVIALAEILKESGKVEEVVHAYYKEAIQALLHKDTHRLSLCAREIRHIDPLMEHLTSDQKIQLVTQEHIVSLSEELKATQEELQYMKRLKAFELMDTIKNPNMPDSERENATDFLNNMTKSSVEYEPAIRGALFAALEDKNAGLFVKIAASRFLGRLLKQSISDGQKQRLRLILQQEREPRIIDNLAEFIRQEKPFLNDAFGKKDWETHFGTLDAVPPIPDDIEKKLNAPCPFHEGALVGETHMLVLVPQKVHGTFLTLNSFADLISKFPQDKQIVAEKHDDGNNRLKKSYWMLMTKEPLPGTINMSLEASLNLVKKHPPYSTTIPIEAAVGITLHYLRHGTRIYNSYILCRQRGQISGAR